MNESEMIISTSNCTGHYKWGDDCDGWYFVKDASLSVIMEQMPPGTAERAHYHTSARQFFFILSGEATFEIDGEIVKVGEQKGVHIEPGTRHRIKNETASGLRFLVVSQPESHGDRVDVEE